MKRSESRTESQKDDNLKPISISVSVIGLSGSSQAKGAVGVGKSSICNRLVRPNNFTKKPISILSSVDFHSDIINGTNWIYWDHIVELIDSKLYAIHIIEQTVLIDDQTFQPFQNQTESDYVTRAVADKLVGSKRAYISPAQFSQSQEYDRTLSITEQQSNIDAFIVVFDVSEVNARDYQAQDRCVTKLLTALQKAKKPSLIVLSKSDIKCAKIKSRFESILEKLNLKSVPIIETSAHLNVNISLIPAVIVSEINHYHRSLRLAKKTYKFPTFDEAFSVKKKIKDEMLSKFKCLVEAEVTKSYHLSFRDLSARQDLSLFLSVVDRTELISEFECCKMSTVKKINESLLVSYLVLFKKTLFQFIPPILAQEQSVQESLLQNPLFLVNFQEELLSESDIFSTAHLTNTVDFPLPRFLITDTHPLNKLHLVNSCIEEIKFKKIENNFEDEFRQSLGSNVELYEDMSFGEIENHFTELQMWNRFRDLASSVFSTFIANRIGEFKVLFDEKLLELSFMIFLCVPVKACMRKFSIKAKDYKDTLPDMDLINNIDKKIYFDHHTFDKKIYQKQRTNWIVKYIGSLISCNPCQCYHFDFNAAMCTDNLMRYLEPFTRVVKNLAIIISVDEDIDELCKVVLKDKMIVIDTAFSTAIEFIQSNELTENNFWNRSFSACQKLIILINEIKHNSDDVLNRFSNKYLSYPYQLSFIHLECCVTNCEPQLLDLVVTRVNDHCNNTDDSNFINSNLLSTIKNQTISYICQTEIIHIWIIVLCDELYDSTVPASFVLSLFNDCVVLERQSDELISTVSMLYIPEGGDQPQRLNIRVLSFHQAFKLLNDKCQFFAIHFLMYFCDLNRLGSINTVFAVLKNLLTVVNVQSIICAIKSSGALDVEDLISRKKMIKRLAVDNDVLCMVIEKDKEMKTWFTPDQEEYRQLKSLIMYQRTINFAEENKNFCKYNTAYENEETNSAMRSKLRNRNWNSGFAKAKPGKCCPDEITCQHSSFESQERTFSQSDSLVSPDMASSDLFFQHDQGDNIFNFSTVEFVDSVPPGCFNENLFCPILEENTFSDEVHDTSTIVLVHCTNIRHIGLDDSIVKTCCGNQQGSKLRSFSGPVQANKSFSKKYSSVPNPFNRSRKYSKKSQSLTTSPVTSYMKSYSQNQIGFCNCKGGNDYCAMCQVPTVSANAAAPKSSKNLFTRFFSSDRSNKQSAEEKRSIFKKSLKFPKKNPDKKVKPILVPNSSSECSFNRGTHSSRSFVLPSPHSTSLSVSDTRNRTKSLSKTVFST